MKSEDPTTEDPIHRDELELLFIEAEKPEAEFRIGGEAEKFGVDRSFAPVQYDGETGVRRVFDALVADHAWKPEAETPGGPVIALTRGQASITLEPGAQLELSGAPHADVHAVVAEMVAHLDELREISSELGITWLGVGFQPLARQEDLPWVPKHRYGVMREYLPKRGSRGLDMMRRTATVQANFDYSSETDALQKLGVMLRLSPIVHAMTACAPFIEGRVSQRKSERGDVWLHMDPSRSGLVRRVWESARPSYSDYVEWALDAGMFLFRRGDEFVHNTGQTFRSFLADGFDGHRATRADWSLHVNTLFPEGRLKRTLEARSGDTPPLHLVGAIPALFTGLLYDAEALGEAAELSLSLGHDEVQAARSALVTEGLTARIGDRPVLPLARRVFEIASGGLRRRSRLDASGRDETVHLQALGELLEAGRSPADEMTVGLSPGQPIAAAEVIRRTRIR